MMTADKRRREQGLRLKIARELAGYRSARDAALSNGWPESTYRAHESGTRTIGHDDAERYAKRLAAKGADIDAQTILFGGQSIADVIADREAGRPISSARMYYSPDGPDIPAGFQVDSASYQVAVIGTISVGGLIDVAADRVLDAQPLYEIATQFYIPPDTFALEVSGDAMWPRYDDGDVLIFLRPSEDAAPLVGSEAAVKTDSGTRYLKRLEEGTQQGRFDLLSHNVGPIRNVKIPWVAEFLGLVRAASVRRLSEKRPIEARKASA